VIRTRRAAAVAAIALAMGTAACSDGPTIEKSELVRRGDEICREAQADIQQRLDTEVAAGETSESSVIRQVLLPGVRAMFDDIESLGTPRGDGDELDDIYDRVDELLDSAAEGELGASGFDERYDAILTDLRDYGFTDCAEGGGG
jgi:hypothetical protein